MAETKPHPERFNKSRNQIREIVFEQIVTRAEDNLCHREPKELLENKLSDLATSFVQEGQATPMTVCDTGATVTANDQTLPAYALVGGHRRHGAIQSAISSHLDPTRIHQGMLVSVVEMVRGEDQTIDEFRQDVLVRSVAENEQRVNHSAIERLAIVKQLEKAEVPVPRAASALGISPSQYRRDAIVANWQWLYDAVVAEQIGATDAAKLAEAAKEKKREKQFREDFQAWVHHKELLLEEERAEQKKLSKELKGAANAVKKYIDGTLIKGWLKCLNEERRFADDDDDFSFGVVVDDNKKTVTVSGLNQAIDKLKSANVASMIAEMQAGVRKLVPVMRRLQQQEQATDVTADEVEAELARMAEEVRRAAAEKAALEAGRARKDEAVKEEVKRLNLADQIDKKLDDIKDKEGEQG